MAKKIKAYKQECGDFNEVKPALVPYRCTSCGVPMPLSGEEIDNCPSCGFKNNIPIEYRELVESKKKHETGLQQAKTLLDKISKPPNPLMMLWYNISKAITNTVGVIMTILLWISGLSFLVVLFIVYIIYYLIAPSIHINLIDVYGPGNVYALTFVALSIIFILPLVLNAYVKDFVELRKTLQASLSARFPEHGSSGAMCRSCGAPIEMPKDHVCVTCSYCKSENIISLPEKWRKKLVGFANWHFKTIEEAFETERKFRKGIKKSFKNWLFATIIAGGIFWLLGSFISWVDNDPVSVPSWSSIAKEPREMVVTEDYTNEGFPSVPYNTVVESKGLASNYWITLDYNETFIFKCWDFPNNVDVYAYNTTSFDEHKIFHKLEWTLMPDSAWQISWKAPYKGLFGITTQIYGKVEHPFTMKWWTEK